MCAGTTEAIRLYATGQLDKEKYPLLREDVESGNVYTVRFKYFLTLFMLAGIMPVVWLPDSELHIALTVVSYVSAACLGIFLLFYTEDNLISIPGLCMVWLYANIAYTLLFEWTK